MEEMLKILVKQLKVELAKNYQSREYNVNRNTLGIPKTIGQYPKNNTGTLSNSISYEIREVDGEEMGLIVMEDYYEFVDRGRKPGAKGSGTKFRTAIDTWVRQKIGTFPNLSFEQTSFLVRRSVRMKGIGGTNFINNAIDNIIDEMVNRGEDEFAQQFEEFIDDKLLVLSKTSRDITYNS
jgi:hypothetical protein